MEREDYDNLKLTLSRVKKALDQRFEKDTELYIPVEQIEEIKKALYTGNYGLIDGMHKGKGYSPEILTKVVVKNAWLIREKDRKKTHNILKIVKLCNPAYLNRIMIDGVFDNKLDMSRQFRNDLLMAYFSVVDTLTAQSIMKNSGKNSCLSNDVLRAVCMVAAYKYHSPLERYQKFEIEYKSHPGLANNYGSFNGYLSDEEFDDSSLMSNIFKNQFLVEGNETYKFWRNYMQQVKVQHKFFKIISTYLLKNLNHMNGNDVRGLFSRIIPMVENGKNEEGFEEYLNCVRIVLENSMDNRMKNGIVSTAHRKLENSHPTWDSKLCEIAGNYGIHIKTTNSMDREEIADKLIEAYNLRRGFLNMLVASFNAKYGNDNPAKHLEYIMDRCDDEDEDDNFEVFMNCLIESKTHNIDYLVFYIENLCDYDDNIETAIEHIKKNFNAHNKLWDRKPEYKQTIFSFFQENDLEGFTEWMQ